MKRSSFQDQKGSSVGGLNAHEIRFDDDGSAALEKVIADHKFQRVPLMRVCSNDMNEELNLMVFVHNKGLWTILRKEEIQAIWGAKKITTGAFCEGLNKNVFKLKSPHLITLGRALREPRSADVIGVYEDVDGHYLLAVRVPYYYGSEKRAAKLGGGAAGFLGTGLLVAKAWHRALAPHGNHEGR
jgi:hypothetical protein